MKGICMKNEGCVVGCLFDIQLEGWWSRVSQSFIFLDDFFFFFFVNLNLEVLILRVDCFVIYFFWNLFQFRVIPISRGDETWVCVHQAGNSVSLVHMAGVIGFARLV